MLVPSHSYATQIASRLINYEALNVDEVVRNPEVGHLVILGNAGTGKSTIAQYLCLLLAGRKRKASDPVPFKILARTFVSEKAKREGSYSLFEYILDEINLLVDPIKCPRKFIEHCFKDIGSLMIFDGIDEIRSAKQRKSICREISEIMKEFHKARFIVTSRKQGYEEAPLSWAGFLHVELESVELSNVDPFIKKWYEYREQDRRKCSERISSFRAAMKDESVQQLSSNPLLLTIMALVNETGSLPRLRTELYETCIKAYLINREDIKGLLWYDVNEVKVAHEYLGYWMHSEFEYKKQQREVDADALKTALLDFLLGESPVSYEVQQKKVMDFIKHARNRIGLITENKRGFFSFGVRSIQEYLAARYINERKAYGIKELWGFLHEDGNRIFNSYWHEVIRFLAGILSQKAREQFLLEVVRENRVEGSILAGGIIAERNPVSDNTRFKICNSIVKELMKTSKKRHFVEILLRLLRTDARDYILTQIEKNSSNNLKSGFELLIFLRKAMAQNLWELETERIDLVSVTLMQSWKRKKLRRICAMALARIAAETNALEQNILMGILASLGQSPEGCTLILEEAEKLNEEQAYHVMRQISDIVDLQDLKNLLKERLKIP